MTVATGFSSHSNSTCPESTKVPRVGCHVSLKYPVCGVSSAWRRRLSERVSRGFQVAKSMVSDN